MTILISAQHYSQHGYMKKVLNQKNTHGQAELMGDTIQKHNNEFVTRHPKEVIFSRHSMVNRSVKRRFV